MKGDFKMIFTVAIGVLVAGVAMKAGRNLPVLKEASQGFDRA